MELDDYIENVAATIDFKSNNLININDKFSITNKEKNVLDSYEIPYMNCNNLKEVIFLVEDAIDLFDAPDELLEISDTLAERDYYQNTNK